MSASEKEPTAASSAESQAPPASELAPTATPAPEPAQSSHGAAPDVSATPAKPELTAIATEADAAARSAATEAHEAHGEAPAGSESAPVEGTRKSGGADSRRGSISSQAASSDAASKSASETSKAKAGDTGSGKGSGEPPGGSGKDGDSHWKDNFADKAIVSTIIVMYAVFFFIIISSSFSVITSELSVYAAAELKCVPPEEIKKDDVRKDALAMDPCPPSDYIKKWHVTGRVIREGKPVDKATVWALANDDYGNTYTPIAKETDKNGAFEFPLIPTQLDGSATPIKTIVVHAIATVDSDAWVGAKTVTKKGQTALTVVSSSRGPSPYLNAPWLLFPLAIFMGTVLASFLSEAFMGPRARYIFTYFSALFMTVSMIGIIGYNMKFFDSLVTSQGEEYQSLGFVHFFKATFADEAEPEWLISFTARPEWYAEAQRKAKADKASALQVKADHSKDKLEVAKADEKKKDGPVLPKGEEKDKTKPAKSKKNGEDGKTNPETKKGGAPLDQANAKGSGKKDTAAEQGKVDKGRKVRGFGAPFWVVFYSVLGASLLIIVLVIKGAISCPDFSLSMSESAEHASTGEADRAKDNRKKYDENLRTILEHQFYLLFAPFSGVFVYQFLVMGEAAAQSTMVALTVLGAGVTLNVILARAVRLAQEVIKPEQEKK